MNSTKQGGKVIVVGHPVQDEIRFSFFDTLANELELIQNLVGSRTETHQALNFAAVHKIRPLVKLHQFDEVPLLFEQLAKDPYHAYAVVKN